MPSRPSIQPTDRPYGHIRHRCQHGRIKFIPRNVSQTQKVEKAYLGHDNVLWSLWRPRKGVRRVKVLTFIPRMLGEPWCEDRRLEIERVSVNQVGEDEVTYHGHARLAQPPQTNSVHAYGVIGSRCQCSRIKIEPAKVSQPETAETTYQRRAQATQPCGNPSRGCLKVYRLSH